MSVIYSFDKSKLPKFSYADKDFNSTIASYLQKIPLISSKWSDLNPSDQGIVLLELATYGLDMLAYYMDVYANEAYIDPVLLRENLFRLVELIDYRPHRAVGASSRIRITLNTPAAIGVPIQKYWQAKNDSSEADYVVAAAEEYVIPAGQSSIDINAIQGRKLSETSMGTGEAGQEMVLSALGICDACGTVNGEEWTETDDWLLWGPNDKVYMLVLKADGKLTVRFGDGVNGKCPGAGEIIAFTYLVTLGDAGNQIGAGIITKPLDDLYDGAIRITDDVTITNLQAFSAGSDVESNDHIKKNARRSLRSLWRMVSGNDIRALIEAYPGVERVYVRDLNSDDAVERYLYTELYVVPSGGGAIPLPLRSALQEFIDNRKIVCSDIKLLDAGYVTANIEIDLYAYSSDPSVRAEAIAAAQQTVRDYFDLDETVGKTEWGTDVDLSAVRAELDKISQVSRADIRSPSTNPSVGMGEIAVLGSLTVNVM